MLVTGLTWTADIPGEPEQTVTFRKLSWREWMEVRERGGAGDGSLSGDATHFLLERSIVSWTYDAEVTPENIDALDPETFAWAADQIKTGSETKTKNS